MSTFRRQQRVKRNVRIPTPAVPPQVPDLTWTFASRENPYLLLGLSETDTAWTIKGIPPVQNATTGAYPTAASREGDYLRLDYALPQDQPADYILTTRTNAVSNARGGVLAAFRLGLQAKSTALLSPVERSWTAAILEDSALICPLDGPNQEQVLWSRSQWSIVESGSIPIESRSSGPNIVLLFAEDVTTGVTLRFTPLTIASTGAVVVVPVAQDFGIAPA